MLALAEMLLVVAVACTVPGTPVAGDWQSLDVPASDLDPGRSPTTYSGVACGGPSACLSIGGIGERKHLVRWWDGSA